MTPTPTFWERLIGWFVDGKLVVFILLSMLVATGIQYAPFGWEVAGLEPDPVPVDAIPDIGENQQIVFTEWHGRSPRDVEDQITYPLTTSLLGIPGVRTIRSSSAFGFSTIYVIFDDDVDFYWSRSRVLEKLSSLPPGTVPDGVAPTLGPDATALGQIFWYTLQGRDEEGNVVGGWDPHELRSIQDWIVRYSLQSVAGVSEVASIGGFVKEYQVDVDPDAMRAHEVTLGQVAAAVRQSNLDVGARTIEINQVEYLVRGLGFIRDVEDLEQTVIAERDHTPIRVSDVARVNLGPAQRRGALDDAGAPAVGGVVVARYLENPMAVLERVKRRIDELAPGLPRRTLEDGTTSQVTIVPFYDRTELIEETLDTLTTSLWQQILITIIVVLVMLRNLRSSVLISMMLPLGVLAAFVMMKLTGVDANIMALGGIAIAIGTMVDLGIVFTENIAQHLEEHSEGDSALVVKRAAAEVAPAVATSVATTVVSFLPVFGLTASEARLFTPLAYTKTFAMCGALLLSIVVLPTLAHLLLMRRTERDVHMKGWRGVALRVLIRMDVFREMIIAGLGVAWAYVEVQPWIVIAALGLIVSAVLRSLLRANVVISVDAATRETWMERLGWAQLVIAVAAVTIGLALDWAPLGPSSAIVNVIFVTVIVGGVLGGFTLFVRFYPRLLGAALRHKAIFLVIPTLIVFFGFTAWLGFERVFSWVPQSVRVLGPVSSFAHAMPGFGREYMPSFDEGAFLYMPTTMPHGSIGAALDLLSEADARIDQIPEVDRVVGKLGRAESALDPAPVSMVETIITYIPEYRTNEDGSRTRQWRDHIRTPQDIWDEIVRVAQLPGLTSAPVLMPIGARIVMLQSGMRAPMGIKVYGPDLASIEAFGIQLESILREVPPIRGETVFADRVVGKPYIEIEFDREAIARHGLTIDAVQRVVQVALGGMTLTRTVEGRERYPVRVRYMREERDSVEALHRVSVPAPRGHDVPLEQLAHIHYVRGPQVIKSEDTLLTSYVLFDKIPEAAEVDVVEDATEYINAQIDSGRLVVPDGVRYRFAGSYENQLRSEKSLKKLIPLALALVLLLLYFQFRRLSISAMIYSGVLVAVSGGFLLIWLYGRPGFMDFDVFGTSMRDLFQVGTVNMSVAVWIGMIALVGVATDDGVVMATYLKQRFDKVTPSTVEEVRTLTLEAGQRRVRPCLMTTATTILALIPVITSQGRGSDVMVPMALPSVGGMAIELVTLFVVPVLWCLVEERKLRRRLRLAELRGLRAPTRTGEEE